MQLGLKLRDYVSLVILKITSPQGARWYLPWRYGRWRGVNAP